MSQALRKLNPFRIFRNLPAEEKTNERYRENVDSYLNLINRLSDQGLLQFNDPLLYSSRAVRYDSQIWTSVMQQLGPKGITYLMVACQQNDLERVKFFFSLNAKLIVNNAYYDDNEKIKANAFKILMDNGKPKNKDTYEIAKLLFQNGLNPIRYRQDFLIEVAAAHETVDYSPLMSCILKYANLDDEFEEEQQKKIILKICDLILDQKVYDEFNNLLSIVNWKENGQDYNPSPLCYAIKFNVKELVPKLIKMGADVNFKYYPDLFLRDRRLEEDLLEDRRRFPKRPIEMAIEFSPEFIRLLIDSGATLETLTEPLIVIALSKEIRQKFIKFMIEKGSDVNELYRMNGFPHAIHIRPLHNFIKNKGRISIEAIKFLLNNGANPNLLLNDPEYNLNPDPPLMYYPYKLKKEKLKLLVDKIDPTFRNVEGDNYFTRLIKYLDFDGDISYFEKLLLRGVDLKNVNNLQNSVYQFIRSAKIFNRTLEIIGPELISLKNLRNVLPIEMLCLDANGHCVFSDFQIIFNGMSLYSNVNEVDILNIFLENDGIKNILNVRFHYINFLLDKITLRSNTLENLMDATLSERNNDDILDKFKILFNRLVNEFNQDIFVKNEFGQNILYFTDDIEIFDIVLNKIKEKILQGINNHIIVPLIIDFFEDARGKTLLMNALESRESSKSFIWYMGKFQFNIRLIDNDGNTLFHYFKYDTSQLEEGGNNSLLRNFFQLGCDINLKNNEGKTPIMTLLESENYKREKVELLRRYRRAILNDPELPFVPDGQGEVDLSLSDNDGNTVMHLAIQQANLNFSFDIEEFIKYLISWGSDEGINFFNKVNNAGETPSDIANAEILAFFPELAVVQQ